MSTEAMKLALEALEGSTDKTLSIRAITTLREALAQPQQEPVAWMHPDEYKTYFTTDPSEELLSNGYWTPLYASPQPAQQEPVEYWTVANGWVSDQAEVPAAVWVEPDFWEHCNRVNCGTAYRLPAPGRQPLYTSSPSQRKPLTDEEIRAIVRKVDEEEGHIIHFARAIEAKHNIKGDA